MNNKFLDLKNKNIIITGGNGFFGKQMSNAFCNQGSNVFVLDMKNSQPKKRVTFFRTDRSDSELSIRAWKCCSMVCRDL